MKTLYGNASINNSSNIVIPTSAGNAAIFVLASAGNAQMSDILYINTLPNNRMPDNAKLLSQKFPQGIFKGFGKDTIVGNIVAATGKMLDDFYSTYFAVTDSIYSAVYSPQAEFQYNGTVGLLSNSVYPDNLFLLLFRLKQVKLTSYWLELFISKYIYYRLGISTAVYIDDNLIPDSGYWILGKAGSTELSETTILAPASTPTVLENLVWTIYTPNAFSTEFQQEITLLVNRISRCDIGNQVTFKVGVTPVQDGFTLIGPTYENDPNTIYGKCLQFTGDFEFPLNIIGYVNNNQ
jgi:hypothetical protein